MCKNSILMKEIVKYHPLFSGGKNKQVKEWALKHPNCFNVTRLIEEAIATASKTYTREDGDHYDFSDGSEMKSVTIRKRPTYSYGKRTTSHFVRITNVKSNLTGTLKIGPLRVIAFNGYTNDVEFYFFPKDIWQKFNISKQGEIISNWSRKTRMIPQWEQYKVKSFHALAKAQ